MSEEKSKKPVFLIKKRDAYSPYFDLKIEVDGIFKSWALPQSPLMSEGEIRMAVPTGDRAIWNTLAADEFIWDTGEYENLLPSEMKDSIQAGRLELRFEGRKLRGRFALKQRPTPGRGGKRVWTLKRLRDDVAGDASAGSFEEKPAA